MLTLVDNFLNKITMYRLVLYYLTFLIALAAVFGAFGILPYGPVAIISSTVVLILVAWVANGVLAAAFKAQANVESVYITAMILVLIITPGLPSNTTLLAFLIWAAVFAMASKYVLALDKKHLFNPVAIAMVITAFTIGQSASWWVGGNVPMMAFVIIGGLLIVRKIQRFDLVLAFLVAAFASDILTHADANALDTMQKVVLHTPIFFFAFIMITEPLTTPPTRWLRVAYGALVGALFSPFIHIGTIYSTPELALVIGNIFSYAVSPKGKRVLTLKAKQKLTPDVYDFVFEPDKKFSFRPGQYLEWTLGHQKSDARGNRRYFTIASSPTEDEIHLGAKFYDPSSTFKKTMLAMEPGTKIVAGQLSGDFTLPRDPAQKLVFIAGGIGITPFRSMVKYLIDAKEKRDAVLLYSNTSESEVAYRNVFDEGRRAFGLKTVYVNTDTSERISAAMIQKEIPDYRERMFYISGTHAMVSAFEDELSAIGIPRTHIKIDFFPGFA